MQNLGLGYRWRSEAKRAVMFAVYQHLACDIFQLTRPETVNGRYEPRKKSNAPILTRFAVRDSSSHRSSCLSER